MKTSPANHFLNSRRFGFAAFCALFLPVASASAQIISIDFGDSTGNDSVVTPSQTLGVVPVANWNPIAPVTASGISLNDNSGSSSGANLSLTAAGNYYIQYSPTTNATGQMFRTYVDSGGAGSGVSSFAFSGLTYSLVDVYVYFDGATSGANRVGSYTVSSGTSTPLPFSEQLFGMDLDANKYNTTTYVNATSVINSALTTPGNYVEFTDVPVVNGSLLLTANADGYSSDGVARSPVNGLQIVDVATVPEPSTYALALGGLAALLVLQRVRRLGNS